MSIANSTEKVHTHDYAEVRFDEGRPRHSLSPLWRRVDAILLEEALDRVSSDFVAQVLERTLDAGVGADSLPSDSRLALGNQAKPHPDPRCQELKLQRQVQGCLSRVHQGITPRALTHLELGRTVENRSISRRFHRIQFRHRTGSLFSSAISSVLQLQDEMSAMS